MKKDEKYFLQKLSCRISRMNNHNKIEELRGPKSSRTYMRPQVPVKNHNKNEEEAVQVPVKNHNTNEEKAVEAPIKNQNTNEEETVQVQPHAAGQEPSPSGPELFSIEICS